MQFLGKDLGAVTGYFRRGQDLRDKMERLIFLLNDLRNILNNQICPQGPLRGYFEKYGQMERYDELTKREKDTKEDFGAIGQPQSHEPRDLGSYLDFLDEFWRSERREIRKGFYSEQSRL